MNVVSMKLLAPGIGWAEISVSRDSSDSSDQVYYWTTDNGAHWKNITPHAARKQELADFFWIPIEAGRYSIYRQKNRIVRNQRCHSL